MSEQPTSAGLQPSSPPSVSILQPPPEAALVRDHAVEVPQPLVPQAEMAQAVEEVTHPISQSEAFLQHLQQVRGSMSFLLGSSHKGAFAVCLGDFLPLDWIEWLLQL